MNIETECRCFPRTFNFLPSQQPSIDCFFMQKVNYTFSGDFEGLGAQFITEQIVDEATPVAPFTFVCAASSNELSTVTAIRQMPNTGGETVNRYQFDIAVPTDVVFTDSTGAEFIAMGTVNIRIEVQTSLTYEQLSEGGMALAVVCFNATSGAAVNGGFSLVLCGSVDIIFVCPALIRVSHEGECSFMSPVDEKVTALPLNGQGLNRAANTMRVNNR